MKLSDMDKYLRNLLSETDNTGNLTPSESLMYLQEGHYEVAQRSKCLRKSDQLTISANDRSVELPDDWLATIRVYATGKWPLVMRNQAYFDQRYLGSDWERIQGAPSDCFHFGRSLYVFPRPVENLNLELWYTYLPDITELKLSDESPLPRDMQLLPVRYAVWQVTLKHLGEGHPQVINAEGAFERLLQQKAGALEAAQQYITEVASYDY